MKRLKLIVTLTATVCALCNAHAQTNVGTFTATMTLQGPTNSSPSTFSVASRTSVLNTAGLIAELGHATGNTNFSKAAKLEVINGTNTQFAVSDGTNFVLIPTNIVSINPTTTNSVISGIETSTSLHEKELMVFEMDFNDIGLGGSDLQFSLRGIGSITITETTTSGNSSAKITLVGDGKQGGTNLVATAILLGHGD